MNERKDGRPLVTIHPVRPEDYVEMIEASDIPEDMIVCKRSPEPDYEEWMDDV